MNSYLEEIRRMTRELLEASELLPDNSNVSNIKTALWGILDRVADIETYLDKVKKSIING
jgi:hypothetical protein